MSAHQIAGSIAALPGDRTIVLVTHGASWTDDACRAGPPRRREARGAVRVGRACWQVRGGGDPVTGAAAAAATRRPAPPATRPGPGDRRGVTSDPATGHPVTREPETGERWRPLLRLLRLARPLRATLLLSVLAGAAATGCGVALLAMSGFLLARASEHPSIVAISLAVVAVRAFSVGRGVSRYVERLASHDVAFRVLADIRVAIYRRLERLAPAGLAAFRSGDLLARLISDVDATQDLFIRGIGPPLVAALVGGGAVTACLLILAPGGAVLALGLLTAATAVPALAVMASRRAARVTAPARGELGATLSDLLSGAADLHAFGADEDALSAVVASDARLTGLARSSAAAAGVGTGLMTAVAGLTVWGVLLLGVAAVSDGTLTRVPLAVLALTALAAFEAVTAMPAAALQLSAARASADRIGAILDAPDPVADPPHPCPLPSGPVRVQMREVRVRYEPGGPLALDGLDLDLRPGRRVGIIGPSGAGKSTVASVLLRFCEVAGGSVTMGGADLASYRADDVRTVIGGCPQDSHIFNGTIAENLRLARPGATADDLTAAAARARLLPGSTRCPRAGTRRPARTAPRCPAVNGSGSCWPGPSWPTRPC